MCPCVVSFLPLLPLPPLTLSTDVAPATKWNVLQLIDCSPLRSIPITGTSSLLWVLLTSHSSLLLRLMRPSVRPPRLRFALFPLIYLPHLLVLPATFWTSSLLADLSVFPSLLCGSCSSGQRFAYSFLQIPPRDGHPCCSAMYFVVAYAYSGLSPVRARPWRANQKSSLIIYIRLLDHFTIRFYLAIGSIHCQDTTIILDSVILNG